MAVSLSPMLLFLVAARPMLDRPAPVVALAMAGTVAAHPAFAVLESKP